MLSVYLLAAVLAVGSSAEDPVVQTPLGKLRGHTFASRSGKEVLAFSGVPYAQPPVGKLRFQPPEAVSPWSGIKDAKKEGAMCIQSRPFYNPSAIVMGEEDCLHLSVYTHNVSGNAPVLVHFHGGGFTAGYGVYHRPEFLMDLDIVIVKVEYRLDVFGFLTFETPEMPGNQGLKDQVMALKWVQQNIKSFGGNPNLVTINGESAGGASIYYHTVSPMSRGLFHRAIAESGTSYSPWAIAPPGYRRTIANLLLTELGCPKNPEEAMPCIAKKDPVEIFTKMDNFTTPLHFGPNIEVPGPNSFLDQPPSKWKHSSVPLLIGTTSAEGLIVTMRYTFKDFDFKSFSDNFNDMAPYLLGYFNTASNPQNITEEIRKFYLPNKDITLDDFGNLTMVFSDSLFTIPIIEGANNHGGDVYFYYFDYQVPLPGIDDKYVIGAFHCGESRFIWNVTYNVPVVSPEEIELSKALVKGVGNFIRTGAPTTTLKWEKWTSGNQNYNKVDLEGFHAMKGFAEDRYKFWKSINYNDVWDNLMNNKISM